MYLGVFKKSNHKYGYISAQVDPREIYNEQKMLEQAKELTSIGPNVMVKIPGSKEGYKVIKVLTSMGIPTNNTLAFTIPQFLTCAEAVKEGVEIARKNGVDLSRWRSVITDMAARYGDLGGLGKKLKRRESSFPRQMCGGLSWRYLRKPTNSLRREIIPAKCSYALCA